MKIHTLIALTMFPLGTVAVQAEVIRLGDGTVLNGQIAEPVEVTIRTADGDRKVPFTLLPADLQKAFAAKIAGLKVAADAKVVPAPAALAAVTDEEIVALASEVSLATWEKVASISSFRDKPEKRGTGGLVVTPAFNALTENWVSVYSPKDPVGLAGDWMAQVARAKALQERPQQFVQRRWLELFIKAGEAVSKRDSDAFSSAVRELGSTPLKTIGASVDGSTAGKNFFTAK